MKSACQICFDLSSKTGLELRYLIVSVVACTCKILTPSQYLLFFPWRYFRMPSKKAKIVAPAPEPEPPKPLTPSQLKKESAKASAAVKAAAEKKKAAEEALQAVAEEFEKATALAGQLLAQGAGGGSSAKKRKRAGDKDAEKDILCPECESPLSRVGDDFQCPSKVEVCGVAQKGAMSEKELREYSHKTVLANVASLAPDCTVCEGIMDKDTVEGHFRCADKTCAVYGVDVDRGASATAAATSAGAVGKPAAGDSSASPAGLGRAAASSGGAAAGVLTAAAAGGAVINLDGDDSEPAESAGSSPGGHKVTAPLGEALLTKIGDAASSGYKQATARATASAKLRKQGGPMHCPVGHLGLEASGSDDGASLNRFAVGPALVDAMGELLNPEADAFRRPALHLGKLAHPTLGLDVPGLLPLEQAEGGLSPWTVVLLGRLSADATVLGLIHARLAKGGVGMLAGLGDSPLTAEIRAQAATTGIYTSDDLCHVDTSAPLASMGRYQAQSFLREVLEAASAREKAAQAKLTGGGATSASDPVKGSVPSRLMDTLRRLGTHEAASLATAVTDLAEATTAKLRRQGAVGHTVQRLLAAAVAYGCLCFKPVGEVTSSSYPQGVTTEKLTSALAQESDLAIAGELRGVPSQLPGGWDRARELMLAAAQTGAGASAGRSSGGSYGAPPPSYSNSPSGSSAGHASAAAGVRFADSSSSSSSISSGGGGGGGGGRGAQVLSMQEALLENGLALKQQREKG